MFTWIFTQRIHEKAAYKNFIFTVALCYNGKVMDKIFENFTINILKINKLITRIKIYEMREYDLKAIHVMCGYYLYENPDGLTEGELVKLTLEDKAAVSRAIKTLGERGFITYNSKKYNSPIKLTEEGKKFAEHINNRSLLAVEEGSATFTEEERAFFYKSLEVLVSNLEHYYDKLIKE